MTEAEIAQKIKLVGESLTGTFDLKLAELRELHRAAEERRMREEAEREARLEAEEQRRKSHESQLLQMQIEEAEERAKRSKMQTRLLGFLIALATSGGGVGIFVAMKQPTDAQKVKDAKPVIESVENMSEHSTKRLSAVEKKTEILKDVLLEQQVQIAEDGEYTRDLIRATATTSQKQAMDLVDVPDSVPKAKAKAEAIKRAHAAKQRELFDAKAADPFAGL